MPFLEINHHNLFYQTSGQGNLALIFIHGLCGDHRVWSNNIPFFAKEYKVISVDLFGHGDSSKDLSPEEAFAHSAEAVEALIEKEAPNGAVLIGHSIAGNILLNCIERNIKNVRGVIFVDSTFNANERVVNSRNKLADSLLSNPSDHLNSAMVMWYRTMTDPNASVQDNALILSALKKIDPVWVLTFLKTTNNARTAPQTSIPLLIIESDWLTKDEPERSFRTAFPNAHFIHWQTSTHFFFVYEPEKFYRVVERFLINLYS